jgi:hypothetical protein
VPTISWLSWSFTPKVKFWQRNELTVPRIAQAICENRPFDRLHVFADALEDGGFDDESILNHCRSVGSHGERGWMVDLLLGKVAITVVGR